MSAENKSENPNPNCCGPEEQASGCDCGSLGKGGSRMKTVIFILIMLAAVGVGTYAFVSKPAAVGCTEQNCGSDKSCCPK